MNLVDEEDDVTSSANLFENLLQALLEVTAITATGDECAKIK